MHTTKNRFLTLISLMLLLGLMVPALAQETTRVDMIVTRDPISFDPHATIDPGAPVLLAQVYDTLVFQDAEGNILPGLAESWDVSDDGLRVTFNLKDGIVFSDGSPLNAEAVAFTFERLQEVGQRSLIFSEISNVSDFEIVDDLTVTFVLEQPAATLLSALTYAYGAVLSPSAVEAAGDDYGMNPVGTGPWMLQNWVPDSEITLVPNPNFSGHRPWSTVDTPPSIDELRVRFSRDESARASALLAGEADIAYIASGSQLGRIEGNDNFSTLENPSRGLNYLGINTQRAPFDDVRVRQAIAQAMNRDDILLVAAEGLGVGVQIPLPPVVLGYDAALNDAAPAYDLDAARSLLEEAGYGPDNPLELTIITSTFPTFGTIATLMQAQLAQVGVVVNVDVLDFSALLELARAGNYDLLVSRWDWNDPDVLRRYLGTENLGNTNRFGYSNPELDALFAEGASEFDPVERAAIYAEAQRILLRDLPIISIYQPVSMVIVNDRLENVELVNSYVMLENATVATE